LSLSKVHIYSYLFGTVDLGQENSVKNSLKNLIRRGPTHSTDALTDAFQKDRTSRSSSYQLRTSLCPDRLIRSPPSRGTEPVGRLCIVRHSTAHDRFNRSATNDPTEPVGRLGFRSDLSRPFKLLSSEPSVSFLT
jgi:hypothetical protein